ncbi:hypothetical protein C900_00322 [Fulvivirga imtechensis AK7]|uniref:Carrier domain-containing protein n=1 Tax=Fulvivirga imtechensis AK7 TaxID=1237149 RepID=L8JJR0_9BACT|nr:acyl carrier protein [Fulvivirga imtechensis]ELR68488.1 hypothetical protein C900_00322 [Fulvivirga imtechensis AK7]
MREVTIDDMLHYFKCLVHQETGIEVDKIDIDSTFHQLGLDSISSVYLLEQIERHYRIRFTPLYFWDYPTIRSLAIKLHQENFA